MVSQYMFHQIRKLKKQGFTNVDIADRLKIHRDTVARHLKRNAPPQYAERSKSSRQDPFVGFEERVRQWLEKSPKLTSPEVFELLQEENYKGSMTTIKRRLKAIKGSPRKERFFEQEYAPGEQSQFDFKERIKLPFKEGELEVYLHFGTLPFSNKFFIQCYPSKNFECYIDGVHGFFNYIGGITTNIRFDNLKPCVSKVYSGSQRKYTECFQNAANYYGVGLLPCSPGKGSDKGDVERDIQTHIRGIQNLIVLKDLRFDSIQDLNEWLKEYCIKRTSDEINNLFNQEKEHLHGLLERREDILCRIIEKKAPSYGIIHVEGVNYSIPDKAIEKRCQLVFGIEKVTIKLLENGEVVAVHPRNKGDSILLEHVINSLVRKPKAMIRWSHKEALFPMPVYSQLYEELKKSQSWRAEQDYLKVLNLVQHVNIGELTVAIELSLESPSDNLVQQITDLLLIEHRPENIINISTHLKQPKLNIELGEYNKLIPGELNEPSRAC